MSLRSKLDRLRMPGAPAGEVPSAAPSPGEGATDAFAPSDRETRLRRLRAQVALFEGQAPRALPASRGPFVPGDGLPGERQEAPEGPLRCVRTELAADHRHGGAPVAGALGACAQELSVLALDPRVSSVDLSRALYIDTETTGLAGGSGTIPFLIGVAFFEAGRLVVEQYLLEQLGQERPMLTRLGERLSQASCVVSYNGKSFDWPLLRTRFVLHRVPGAPPPVHLDLLHCARRVFKRRLGGVRLTHVEEEVLGFTREGDIPGALIPETYLGYLRGRVPGEALAPIVEHNRHDLVALAALLGELSRRFSCTDAGQDPRDRLGMAEVAARARDPERAIGLAQLAEDADVRGELSSRAAYLAGRWAKQRGDVAGAQCAFERAVEHARDPVEAARAHLELAKLLEHQLRIPTEALRHAQYTAVEEGEAAQVRRVARLERRVATERQGRARARARGSGR